MLGDDTGPTFFAIDQDSGEITVRSDLTRDTSTLYKLRIQVSDGGDPPCVQTAVVTVTVRRNLNDPELENSEWEVEILEIHSLDVPVVQLEGEDADTQHPHDEFTYQLTAGSEYQDIFMVDGETGNVLLRRSLVGEEEKEYEVTMEDGL